jgi:hypothetical protein
MGVKEKKGVKQGMAVNLIRNLVVCWKIFFACTRDYMYDVSEAPGQ